jgi:hypothetical protein
MFGSVGSALGYPGSWLLSNASGGQLTSILGDGGPADGGPVTFCDGGTSLGSTYYNSYSYLVDGGPVLLDAGPALVVELYNSGPGVACYQQFGGQTYYIEDGGPITGNNASLYPSVGQWGAWINFAGVPSTGLAPGKVNLVTAINTAAYGTTPNDGGPSAVLQIMTLIGEPITSYTGTITITAGGTSSISGTIDGYGTNLLFSAGGPYWSEPSDIAAAYAAGLTGSAFSQVADAGYLTNGCCLAPGSAPPAIGDLYAAALSDSQAALATLVAGVGTATQDDAGLNVAVPIVAALLADPDAGGTFALKGSFVAPICSTPYVPAP